jgi:hypothetical protein
MPTSSIMTGQALPRTLQTALSDVVGAAGECNFEYREGVQPPKAIGIVTSSGTQDSSPLLAATPLVSTYMCFPSRKCIFRSGHSAST